MDCRQSRRYPWLEPEENLFPNIAPMGKENMTGVPHLCEHQEELRKLKSNELNSDMLNTARETIKERCQGFQTAPGYLQARWRNVGTLPEKYDPYEAEAALLDALITEGGIPAWSGDGSSCAEQIVRAVWERGERYRKELEEIKAKIKSITG
jgi:hypothetical protein